MLMGEMFWLRSAGRTRGRKEVFRMRANVLFRIRPGRDRCGYSIGDSAPGGVRTKLNSSPGLVNSCLTAIIYNE